MQVPFRLPLRTTWAELSQTPPYKLYDDSSYLTFAKFSQCISLYTFANSEKQIARVWNMIRTVIAIISPYKDLLDRSPYVCMYMTIDYIIYIYIWYMYRMYVSGSRHKFEWDIVCIALRCAWARFSIVKLQTEICWFGTSSLPQDLQMVRWTRPSVKRYLLFLKSQHSQPSIPSMTRKHRKQATNFCSGPGSFQSLLLVHGLQCELQMHHTSRSSPRMAHIATLCTVSLCISWCLFVWFRMSPPGNAMCTALHHLAAAAPLLCALGVCKRHQKTLRIGRYWEILRDIERYWEYMSTLLHLSKDPSG